MNELTERLEAPMLDVAPPDDDDATLVACAQRDSQAFGELYERHYPAILNYLYRRTLDPELAEELTANTFFKALRGLGEFQSRPTIRFRTWLYRIATNEAGMRWRRLSVRGTPRMLTEDSELAGIRRMWPECESTDDAIAKREEFSLVHAALGELPSLYRTVLMLRFFEGMSHDEVGEVLEKPVGTVKSLVHRGLGKFAEAMKKLGAE